MIDLNFSTNEMTAFPDSKVPGAIMGPIWCLQDPGEPHFGPMNFAIWVVLYATYHNVATIESKMYHRVLMIGMVNRSNGKFLKTAHIRHS